MALINWRALSRPASLTVVGGGGVVVVGMDVVGGVAVGTRPRKFVLLPLRRSISEKVFFRFSTSFYNGFMSNFNDEKLMFES